MNLVFPTLHVRRSPQSVSLAAACLAAALPQSLRQKARILDLFLEQEPEPMVEAILAHDPDLVTFSLYVWNRDRVLELCGRLRALRPEVILVAGGPEVYADPEKMLREGGFDAVVRGEGEATFSQMVQSLARGEALGPIPGLTVATGDGVVSGGSRPPAAELDAFPSPWLTGTLVPEAGGGVLWETSRGCPFSCDFCFDARGSQGVRPLPMARLAEELELFAAAGVSQVWVLDSTFNYPPERGKQLLRLLARKAPFIHFHLEAKADFLDKETAHLLSKISCSIQIGLQSAHPEVLRHIHRSLDPDQFARRLQQLAHAGLTYGIDLIYGLPGDNHAGFRKSLDLALSLAPNHIDLFPLAVLPGTALYAGRESYGLKAMASPPYEIIESLSWSRADLEQSRLLAAAADLFYNTGRAVAFFGALLRGVGLTPAEFLDGFARWALAQQGITPQRLCHAESWQAADALPLQAGYMEHLLGERGRQNLLPATRDLLNYHFFYAETLLGCETLPPAPETLEGLDPWSVPLQLAPGVRLVSFSYEILDLLEMGDADLEQMAEMFRPVGSVAVFFRRGEEVMCESLEEDFLTLLRGCEQRRSARQSFAGSVPRRAGEEIVCFALAEGLVVPA